MTPKALHTDCTIVVLAGGQSSRMGFEKGLLEISGTTFIESLLGTIQSLTDNILISVGEQNKESYSKFGFKVIVDEYPEKGPVGGVCSVLGYIKTPWFFLISVDAPLINKETLFDLWDNRNGNECVLYSSGKNKFPLVALYFTESKSNWYKALANNDLRVMDVVGELKCKLIEVKDNELKYLTNINTKEEYTSLINSVNK